MRKLFILLLFIYFGHASDTFEFNNILPTNKALSHTQKDYNENNTLANLKNNFVREEQSTEPCQQSNNRRFDDIKGSDVPHYQDRDNNILIRDEKVAKLESSSVYNNISPNTDNERVIVKPCNDNLPPTRRILPGILKNATKEEIEYNKLFQQKSKFKRNDALESPHNTRRSYTSNYDKDTNYDSNVDDINFIEERTQSLMEDQLIEPTKGEGISNMKDRSVTLLENDRVCYACSSMSDPTCWAPDKRTTTKYCQKGHNSCLTKSFKYKGTSFVVRDCGSYCVNQNGNRYSSCSICHSDLCNSAPSIRIFNMIIAIAIIFGIMFNKC